MRKRLTAVLLSLCMMLALLPAPAYAAVRELVGNPAEENQALLEELEALTGQDGEAVLELLEAYGLLDEDGNLITDQTVTLNGAEYTLEEIEAMLNDPATDLSEVGYVGDIPIALGDLKTIIAIERELQRIQEIYFSGTPFEGESLDNLNDLLDQVQASGITVNGAQTLAAGSGTRVANVGDIDTLSLGGSGTANIDAKAGDTLSVNVTYQPGILQADSVTVSLGDHEVELTSSNPKTTLSYSVTDDENVPLTVKVSVFDSPTDYVYGELTGAVQFTNPQGFVFQSGSRYYPAHTVLLSEEKTPQVMYTAVGGYGSPRSEQVTVSADSNQLVIPFVSVENGSGGFDVGSSYKGNIGIDGINRELEILQGARDDKTYKQQFTVSARVDTLNENTRPYSYYAKVTDSNYSFTPAGNRTITAHFTGNIGGAMSYTMTTDTGVDAVPSTLTITEPYKDVSGAPALPITIAQLHLQGCNVSLTDDGAAPQLLSATAPEGTYYPGQRIPITLKFDEFVMAHDPYYSETGSVSCNNHESKSFKDSDLHMNARGNEITFWYTVLPVDSTNLSITSCTGNFRDLWGNTSDAINGKPIEGVTIVSTLMRDAITGASASYDAEAQTATVSITLTDKTEYKTKYSGYDPNAGAELKEVPFQAVITDNATGEVKTEQIYSSDGTSFTTKAFSIPRTEADQSFTVTIQANEGTYNAPEWVDLSYKLSKTLNVPALVQASKVVVSDKSENYTLSLADYTPPVLTATVYGADEKTLATHQTGTWSSSNTDIATISNGENSVAAGTVVLTGQTVGTVTFTFTADNGTPDKDDNVDGTSRTYTVVAGENLALNIPGGASRIVARQYENATVLWISNANLFVQDKDFQYTVELFEGNYTTEDQLAGKTAKATYQVSKEKTSVVIPGEMLTSLSDGSEPAYTVRVSMPHPNVSGDDSVRLSALTWIVVQAEPATAILERPENIYVTDGGTLNIQWTLENYTNQEATLTIWRVEEDNPTKVIYEGAPTNGTFEGDTLSGTYSLELAEVNNDYLKDTYQIMLSVDDGEVAAPSSDSFPLYVYNGDALQIVNSQGEKIESLTLDNTDKVSDLTGSSSSSMSTSDILAMRQELGLLNYIGINYGDYRWNSFRDGIAWATSNDAIAINYKQGSLYENIKNFSMTSYVPELMMGISSVEGGTATITATHAATGTMKDSIKVTANTLRNKFYLFQATPAVPTTVRYVDGSGNSRSVTTNDQGVLALYEPNGIDSDVWFSSESGGTEYMGTIYLEDVQSGERDATKLQLYPLNTIRLREAARAELTFVRSDGTPLAETDVTVRGGVYKNGYYCEGSGIGTGVGNMQPGGATQPDTKFRTDENGKITIYFDATQFWSKEAGESAGTVLASTDKIQYALEIRIDGYYPVFQVVSGSVSLEREMQTAAGVVVLETVPAGEENKPFVARQAIDYGLSSGELLDVRHSTGHVGPSTSFKQAELITTMLLWGETDEASSYSLTITDETGYAPAAQVPTSTRYPFTSIPAVENVLTLNAETMTDSGWIADGKDMGLKTRLTKNGVLLQERTMPFRAMDLTRVTPVNEDENVTQVLLTMQQSSIVNASENMGNVGGSSIFKTLNGRLDDLAGPIDGSLFKMLITPSKDPAVFNALIWTGYDTLGLEDVEFTDGVGISGNFMSQELEVDVPGVGDISEMASGTYDPASMFRENKAKGSFSNMELGLQLTGYYEAEIRYNSTSGKWEAFTKGGGFSAGAGIGFEFSVNAWVGPVPVTGTFGVGGAVQLEFKAASRYSQQTDPNDNTTLEWSDPNAAGVTDFLTNLRLNAYVEAFGGVGFDYSVVALKIGLFGSLDANLQNRFLSRTYLKDTSKQQQSGQNLSISGEVGIKFVAKFLFISYEAVLASGEFGAGQGFGDWSKMEQYWDSATTGLSAQSIQYEAAASGLRIASSTATLQSRDYLETYARTWGQPMRLFASLFSLDDDNGVKDLQGNANPASFPELSDDGRVLVYISDSDSASIYDSAAHYSIFDGSSYPQSTAIPGPDDFKGCGDSDADVAGTGSFAVAAWVRMNTNLPGKDAKDDVTAAEQNLLINGTEIVVSIYDGNDWTSERLTDNATPDLSPVVATDGKGRAVVFWRSVYNAGPDEEDLLNFQTQDYIMYRVYDGSTWSPAKMLYNGSSGSVKALQAAMLPDGTAMAVYTLDRSRTGTTNYYEIGYTIVDDNGDLGASMIATSDNWVDENPQVIAANFGDGSDRFVIGWHSMRNGTSDIQLLAVDAGGAMSNTFPASLSALTSSGQATVGGNFRFATLSGNYGVDDLTIIWSEQINDEMDTSGLTISAHSILKAAKFLPDSESYRLTAALELAELDDDTLTDHFSAYVSGENEVKAVIQATFYNQSNPESIPDAEDDTKSITVPGETVMLYTATSNFQEHAVEVEEVYPDYENLMADSLVAIQFTVRNTGLEDLTDLTITMGTNETAELRGTLKPNESTVLTVYHRVGEEVKNQSYTVSGTGFQPITNKVYLDYPDVGISRMEVLKEEAGKRTISITLYNSSDATLAGKDRQVEVAFSTDSLFTDTGKANVTYNGSQVNTITISDEADLERIDAGSFTMEVTYDVGGYVEAQGQKEIPFSGVYLYAKACIKGTIGTQSGSKRLPEFRSSDNQAAVHLTGAYARTGKQSTLDVVQTNATTTTATVSLRNNTLNPLTTQTLMAVLLDASGRPLETKNTGISGELAGETGQTQEIAFTKLGSSVAVYAFEPGQDSLIFEGLPVSLDDFKADGTGALVYRVSGISANGTLVTAVSGANEQVVINGEAYTGTGSVYVPIGVGETAITVSIGGTTYTLYVTSTHTSGGGGSVSKYNVTVDDSENGTVTSDRVQASVGSTVTLTTKPDEGYRLGSLTVTRRNGSEVTVRDEGNGKYTFTMPASAVTIEAIFVPIDPDALPFVDVPADAYYYDAVDWAVSNGITNGTSDTMFSPNNACTRAQMVTFLWRSAGSPEPSGSSNPFTDVAASAYYYDAVLWAVEQGITNGTTATTFSPNATVTRGQTVTFLWRFAGAPAVSGTSFADVAESAYYATAVAWAASEGITSGTTATTFSPNNPCTRAQIVTFLYRAQ